MNLAEAIIEFEKCFEQVVEFDPDAHEDKAIAPTGERYISLTQRGPKAPGAAKMPMATAKDAVAGWLREARRFAPGKVRYWRERPTLDCETFVQVDVPEGMRPTAVVLYFVYSRFATNASGDPGNYW